MNNQQTINQNSKLAPSERRKFHDAWAFFLFIIALSINIVLGVYIIRYSKSKNPYYPAHKSEIISDLGFDISGKSYYNAVQIYNFSFLAVLKLAVVPNIIFILSICLLYLLPTLSQHIFYLLGIIFPIYLYFNNGFVSFKGFGLFGMSLMSLMSLFLYLLYFSFLRYFGKPFQLSLKIILKGMGIFLPIIMIQGLLLISTTMLAINIVSLELFSLMGILYMLFFIFFFFWIWNFIILSSHLLISALVILHLVNNLSGMRLIVNSFKIVLYGIGSTCFGSFILGIVKLIRLILEFFSSRSSDYYSSSIFSIVVLQIFPDFEIFIEHLSSWTMTIVALKGTSLTKSLKTVMFNRKNGLVATFIFRYIFFIVGFVALGITYSIFSKESRILSLFPLRDEILSKFPDVFIKEGENKYLGVNMGSLMIIAFTAQFVKNSCDLLEKTMEMVYLIFSVEPEIIKNKDIVTYECMLDEWKNTPLYQKKEKEKKKKLKGLYPS